MITHFKLSKNQSLIARIYGLYNIKSNIFGSLDFIVMQNTAQLTNTQAEKMVFDLKGSLKGRFTHLPSTEH